MVNTFNPRNKESKGKSIIKKKLPRAGDLDNENTIVLGLAIFLLGLIGISFRRKNTK
ncbi:LPXTG cell wall anchor domain-containing protein [Listeria monocytogenes]|nr:LPXTG cell wall anchor domain-containing protein [Listeria monocytogenes]